MFIVHFALDCLDDPAAVNFMEQLRKVAQKGTHMIVYFNRGSISDSLHDGCPPGGTESPIVDPQTGGAVVPKGTIGKEVRDFVSRPSALCTDIFLTIKYMMKSAEDSCRCRPFAVMEKLVQKAGWKIVDSAAPCAPANQTIIAGV